MSRFPDSVRRNIHRKVFGGYLLRQAFELAWATACMFTGQHAHFRSMSDVNFMHPVDIGDILHFSARVEYTRSASDRRGFRFASLLFTLRLPVQGIR